MPNAFPTLKDGIRHLAVTLGIGKNFYIPSADNEPERCTYHAAMFNLTPNGTCTDIVLLGGATNKIIRLKEMVVSGTATNATNIGLYIFKRTSAPVGGTSTAITKVASSTNDPASVASLVHYATAPPTVGTGAMMKVTRLNLAPAANGSIDRFEWDFSWKNDKSPMAESATEYLALGMNGNAIPAGGGLDISLTWTEEDVQS